MYELPNDLRLRILANKEISRESTDGKVLSRPPKTLTFVLQSLKKSAVKHFVENPMFLNFVDLSTLFRPRLFEETFFHL